MNNKNLIRGALEHFFLTALAMITFQSPSTAQLLNVSLSEVPNGSHGGTAQMLLTGTLQVPSQEITEGIKLRVEGQEKVMVEHLNKKQYTRFFGSLKQKESYTRSQEHLVFGHDFLLADVSKNEQNDMTIISFSIPMPVDTVQSMSKREVRHNIGHINLIGEMSLSYTIQAFLSKADDELGDTILSKPITFSSPSIQKQETISSLLKIQVGQSMVVPNTWFFGLLQTPATETFVLKSFTKKLTLCPGQDLRIRLGHDETTPQSDTSPVTLDLMRIKVAFTERIFCKAEEFEIKHKYQHWKQALIPDTTTKAVEGTVQVPLFRSPSYDGKLIKVWHEMTVFVTQDERQSTHSNPVLGTTPVMEVSVVNVSV